MFMLLIPIWLKILQLYCEIVLCRLHFKICGNAVMPQIFKPNMAACGKFNFVSVMEISPKKAEDQLKRTIYYTWELKLFFGRGKLHSYNKFALTFAGNTVFGEHGNKNLVFQEIEFEYRAYFI